MAYLKRLLMIAMVAMALPACVADKPHQSVAKNSLPLPKMAVATEDYTLAHVEFDDQGWFHDIRQRQELFKKLRALKENKKSVLIVTYTHGWKHSSSGNDDNLSNFRKLLSQLVAVERATDKANSPRAVVGVYIGWRGSSVPIPFVENLTFWTRKNAAERVGMRSVKQLFFELNQFRVIANNWPEPDQLANRSETQLIFVGHSFGGLVTYYALHSSILERGLLVNENGDYRVAKSFGDFVLLVNPAFEGAAYEPIWQAARLRGCYPPSQKPVMAIVTSTADHATRYAFPVGRLYTYLQSATLDGERETVLHTVGHLDRYRTHRLEKRSNDTNNLASTDEILTPEPQPNAQHNTSIGEFDLIKTNPNAPALMPYLVIEAGPELIADHNDFWNDSFRKFTVQFIASQILAPPSVLQNKTNDKESGLGTCSPPGAISSVVP